MNNVQENITSLISNYLNYCPIDKQLFDIIKIQDIYTSKIRENCFMSFQYRRNVFAVELKKYGNYYTYVISDYKKGAFLAQSNDFNNDTIIADGVFGSRLDLSKKAHIMLSTNLMSLKRFLQYIYFLELGL